MKIENHNNTDIRKSYYRKEYIRAKHYACDKAEFSLNKVCIEEIDNIYRELKENKELLSRLINNSKVLLISRSEKIYKYKKLVTTIDAIMLAVETDIFKKTFPQCAQNKRCVELVYNVYMYAIMSEKKEEKDEKEKSHE